MKATVTDINEIPEPLRGEYDLREGKYVLKVEGDDLPGFVPASRHAEFRDNNRKIVAALGVKTTEEALARVALIAGIDPAKLAELKDIDPAEYKRLKTEVEALAQKGVKKPDDVAAAIQAALDSFKTTVVKPLQDQLAAKDVSERAKDERLARAAIREAVAQRFAKAGGRADAGVLDFILSRASESFRVVDDKVVAAEGRYGSTGEPLTVDEWITAATKEHAFAFEPSKGGGASGGAGTGLGASRSGGRKLINPSPQELGELKFVPGKGLTDPRSGQLVEIVKQ